MNNPAIAKKSVAHQGKIKIKTNKNMSKITLFIVFLVY